MPSFPLLAVSNLVKSSHWYPGRVGVWTRPYDARTWRQSRARTSALAEIRRSAATRDRRLEGMKGVGITLNFAADGLLHRRPGDPRARVRSPFLSSSRETGRRTPTTLANPIDRNADGDLVHFALRLHREHALPVMALAILIEPKVCRHRSGGPQFARSPGAQGPSKT